MFSFTILASLSSASSTDASFFDFLPLLRLTTSTAETIARALTQFGRNRCQIRRGLSCSVHSLTNRYHRHLDRRKVDLLDLPRRDLPLIIFCD